jgi:hypothetical protein
VGVDGRHGEHRGYAFGGERHAHRPSQNQFRADQRGFWSMLALEMHFSVIFSCFE